MIRQMEFVQVNYNYYFRNKFIMNENANDVITFKKYKHYAIKFCSLNFVI